MEVFALTDEIVSAFWPLLPEDTREADIEGGIVLLGAAEQVENGDPRACGTAVLQMVDEDTWFLTWLLVAPDFRQRGAGGALLALAQEIADFTQMQIYTVFSEHPESVTDSSLYRLFERQGFVVQTRGAKSYTIPLSRIGEEDFFKSRQGKGDGFASLNETPAWMLVNLNRSLEEQGQLLTDSIFQEAALADISVTYASNGEITACVIFEPIGENGVSLSFLYAHKRASAQMPALLRRAWQLLSRRFPPETELVIPCVTEPSRKLVEKLLSSATLSLVTYSARYYRGRTEN